LIFILGVFFFNQKKKKEKKKKALRLVDLSPFFDDPLFLVFFISCLGVRDPLSPSLSF